MFTRMRDVSLMRKFNRELMGNIITQQAAFYQFKMEETKVNIYGEAAGEKYYNGPFLFNCLINRENQNYNMGDDGVEYLQGIEFYFFRDDLVDANVVPTIGDIVLYQESYFEIDVATDTQYFVGKDPDYPYEPNPLNPGLEQFGYNVSFVCNAHYVPADRVGIVKQRL